MLNCRKGNKIKKVKYVQYGDKAVFGQKQGNFQAQSLHREAIPLP
jgi:hypothetical protein